MVRTRRGTRIGESSQERASGSREERRTENERANSSPQAPLGAERNLSSRVRSESERSATRESVQYWGSRVGEAPEEEVNRRPPPAEPVGASPFPLDAAVVEQIVKAALVGALAASATPARETVTTLVKWVKYMRDLGCVPFSGEEDAEIAGQWLWKVEESLEQIPVPAEMRVNCVAQFLAGSAQTWWATVRSRRMGEEVAWEMFRLEFENRYYTKQHQRAKEHEFLVLKQGGMTVVQYERRFQDLSMFAASLLPTEQHRVERFRDGLNLELRKGLVTTQFGNMRALVEAAQALESVVKEGAASGSRLREFEGGKRKEDNIPGIQPYQAGGWNRDEKRFRRGGSMGRTSFFSPRRGGMSFGSRPTQSVAGSGRAPMGSSEFPNVPWCRECRRNHPGDCRATPGRCYVCRQEGHSWKNCRYWREGCRYCGESGHLVRNCPKRAAEWAQSQQPSVTVN